MELAVGGEEVGPQPAGNVLLGQAECFGLKVQPSVFHQVSDVGCGHPFLPTGA